MEKRITKCVNGHFFDGNKYEICPTCGGEEIAGNVAEINGGRTAVLANVKKVETQEEKKKEAKKSSFFDFVKFNKSEESINKVDDKTYKMDWEPETQNVPSTPAESQQKEFEKEIQPMSEERHVDYFPKEESARGTTPVSGPTPIPRSEENSSLADQIKKQATTIDAKTTGRYTTESAEPVVGWLVAVTSASQGMSFELYEGKNSIGRMRTNRIALELESGVSREKHAFVLFDAKNSAFYIQAGESDKIVYLNNTPVLMPMPLKAYDVIQLGECDLMFIPLCGENFKWEDYIK